MVVANGETDREPDAATVPTPWLMLTDVAFVLDHDNVAAEPAVIDAGLAVSVTVGGCGGGGAAVTFTVTVDVVVPPLLVAESV